ncbi:MAG TPA: hypothetical protein VGL81_28770 [Polyangiaceae bacterium]
MPRLQASDTRRALAGLSGLTAILLVVACSEGTSSTACLPEDVERCACDDGREGFTVCAPDGGGGYGACNCDLDASPYLPEPEEASTDANEADGSGGDGGLMFMSACTTTSGSPPCPPGTTCDDFPAKGQFCSKKCTEATDCPPPSPGCNMNGVCKAP